MYCIVDLSDGRSFFMNLEEYEEVFIYPLKESRFFVLEIRDCRKPFKNMHQRFSEVEKFTIESDD